MGCGASQPSDSGKAPKSRKDAFLRQVSDIKKVEEVVSDKAEAVTQAGRAGAEVAGSDWVAAAGGAIEALLSTAGEVPVLGGVFRLLGKCWNAAKAIHQTERSVEKLMLTAASLEKHLRRASALSDDDVKPLADALEAVADFLTQRAKPGTAMHVLTLQKADEKVTELDNDLRRAMQELNVALSANTNEIAHETNEAVKDMQKILKRQGEAPPAGEVFAYVAIQRPPVVVGHVRSLSSFFSCMAGVVEALESRADEFKRNGYCPVSVNDGGEAPTLNRAGHEPERTRANVFSFARAATRHHSLARFRLRRWFF